MGLLFAVLLGLGTERHREKYLHSREREGWVECVSRGKSVGEEKRAFAPQVRGKSGFMTWFLWGRRQLAAQGE